MISDTVNLPALPEQADDTLRLRRDLAVAALAVSNRISLAEAAATLEAVMKRVRDGVDAAMEAIEAERVRSPEVQRQAVAERDRWSGIHGQTVAGPNADRIER